MYIHGIFHTPTLCDNSVRYSTNRCTVYHITASRHLRQQSISSRFSFSLLALFLFLFLLWLLLISLVLYLPGHLNCNSLSLLPGKLTSRLASSPNPLWRLSPCVAIFRVVFSLCFPSTHYALLSYQLSSELALLGFFFILVLFSFFVLFFSTESRRYKTLPVFLPFSLPW